MKKYIILAIFAWIIFPAFAQNNYVMYETVYITPKPDKIDMLYTNLAAHNRKYHSTGPFSAYVWNVYNGPKSGQLFLAMGPCTFSDLDNRPSGEDHEKDWNTKISPFIEGYSSADNWRMDEKLSHIVQLPGNNFKRLSTSYDVKNGEMYRFNELLKKVSDVWKEKNYPFSFQVFYKVYGDDKYDVIISRVVSKWADLDWTNTIRADYEEKHGAGSWTNFMKEYDSCLNGTERTLLEYMPKLSGPVPTIATK
jgi:hypothetical protein